MNQNHLAEVVEDEEIDRTEWEAWIREEEAAARQPSPLEPVVEIYRQPLHEEPFADEPLATESKMVPQVFLKFLDSPVRREAYLARSVVLYPLGRRLGYAFTRPALFAGLIRKWWRELVGGLYRAGAPKLSSAGYRRVAVNCFPSMFRVDRPVKVMNCRHVFCPWCWGRRAEWLIHKLALDDEVAIADLAEGRKLVCVKYDQDMPATVSAGAQRDCMESVADGCRGFTLAHRSRLDGAFWQTYMEPTQDGLAFRLRMLAIRKTAGGSIYNFIPRDWEVSEGDVSRETLTDVIKSVVHYPTGVACASIPLLSRILEAREGARLCESTGFFRERSLWKKA